MTKNVFLLLMVALTGIGCSNTTTFTGEDDLQAIAVRSDLQSMGVASRAPFTEALSASNPLKALVLSSSTAGNYTTTVSEGTMTFKGGNSGVAYDLPLTGGTELFPDNNPLYLSGFFPDTWAKSANTVSHVITGTTDVMRAAQVSTSKEQVRNQQYATLAFEHALTKLEMRFRSDANEYGLIRKIELIKENGTAPAANLVYDFSTATETYTGTVTQRSCFGMSVNADDVVTYTNAVYAGNHELTTENVYLAYTLTAPVNATVADKEYTFRITYAPNGEAEQVREVTVDLFDINGDPFTGSTRGYSFLISFYFLRGAINADATVAEWKLGGETIEVIE